MKSTLQKGFTLIELLVVVAIIALLSATIIGSLSGARTKARDARATSELSSMRAQAELYYNNNNFSYGTAGNCTNAPLVTASSTDSLNKLYTSVAGYVTAANVSCDIDPSAWAIAAKLSSAVFCVDSNGVAKSSTSAGTAAAAINTTLHACN